MKLLRANTHRQLLNVVKQRKTSYLGHILQGPKTSSQRPFSSERSRGKEDQIVDNIHGSATSGTATTSQTLSLYSNVQKRTLFALCDGHVKFYTLHWAYGTIRRRRKRLSRCSFYFDHHAGGGKAANNDVDRRLGWISFLFLPFSPNEKRTFVTFVGWDADKRTVPFPFRRPF